MAARLVVFERDGVGGYVHLGFVFDGGNASGIATDGGLQLLAARSARAVVLDFALCCAARTGDLQKFHECSVARSRHGSGDPI